jgi:protein-disulfide isomerase
LELCDSNIKYNNNNNNKSDNDKNASISIKRSTFTKIMVVGVVGLMFASFFAGFSVRSIPLLAGPLGAATTPVVYQMPPSIPGLQQAGSGAPAAPVKVSNITLDGAIIKGKPNAPVTLVDFSDFQCPFCQRYSNTTFPQLMKDYVDTGKVKYAFMQFPLDFHPNAKPAAIAAQCANEQGKFWPFHDVLYSTQDKWQSLSGNETTKVFKQYAATLKLDTAKFNTCVDSKKYDDQITKDTSVGSKYQVSGTPTFYIGNDKKGYTQLVGAQPVSTFKQQIDQLLAS